MPICHPWAYFGIPLAPLFARGPGWVTTKHGCLLLGQWIISAMSAENRDYPISVSDPPDPGKGAQELLLEIPFTRNGG